MGVRNKSLALTGAHPSLCTCAQYGAQECATEAWKSDMVIIKCGASIFDASCSTIVLLPALLQLFMGLS